jgi:hypothetical protein
MVRQEAGREEMDATSCRRERRRTETRRYGTWCARGGEAGASLSFPASASRAPNPAEVDIFYLLKLIQSSGRVSKVDRCSILYHLYLYKNDLL